MLKTEKIYLDDRVALQKRSYHLFRPSGVEKDEPVPLVLAVHGAFSGPLEFAMETGFNAVAEREGFMVAYPTGAYGIGPWLRHWNAGHCCGKAQKVKLDDTGFLLSVIDDISERYGIDPNRVYMTGFSNGGMLVYTFAAKYTDRLAAIAVLGSTLSSAASAGEPFWTPPKPKGPVPVLVFHAKDDESIPFVGGRSMSGKSSRVFLPVADSIRFWVENNGCDKVPIIEKNAAIDMDRSRWASHGDQNSTPVVFYSMDNMGHRWPNSSIAPQAVETNPAQTPPMTEIIWQFFSEQSKTTPRR